MNVAIINEKEAVNLKKTRSSKWGWLERGKVIGNDVIIV